MVDYKYKDLFNKSHVDKQLKIAAEDGTFTALNPDIHQEDFQLTESLCSESELRFGCCEASMVKFQIRNAFIPLAGKWITIAETLDGNEDVPFQYGRYKVFSDVPTADREYRDITAYDAMYDILGADVAAWYNSILPTKESRVTLKQFRESFVRYFGLTEVVPEGGLVNDDMIVEKTIDIVASSESESETSQTSVIGEALSGRDVITAICEINGCFGHIGRDGKFYYIYLPQAIEGLYPADDLFPSNTLYPRDPKGTRVGNGTYINIKWEDFNVRSITKLQIRQEENDIGKIWPETPPSANDNCYIIQGNFLVYGKSSDELKVIAQNILGKIAHITYMPLELCEAMGNPCLEVGDPIRLSTKYRLIETYVLERTAKGIQALRDTYKANGVEQYAEKVNGIHQSILQLKGKSNVLERTIEITRLEMKDLGAGLSTEISITAGQIRTELQNTKDGLETTITTTAAGIRADVSKTYETKTNASAEYTSIRSSVSVEAGRISSEIERATKAEQNLSGEITSTNTTLTSKIEQTEKDINLSVNQKIEETKTYASTQATVAQNAANAATDNKLKSYSTTTQMNAAISIAVDGISLSVSKSIEETKTYASTQATAAQNAANAATDNKLKSYSTTTQMNAAIKLSADGITSTVSATYETKTNASKEYTSIKSSVQQNANSIAAEVTRASSAEGTLSTRITATENGLTTKVSKGSISSEISQEAGQISISANRFVLSSTNCSIAADGTISAKNVDLSGKITASSGEIGGFKIGSTALYTSATPLIGASGVYLGNNGISCSGNLGSILIKSDGSAEFKTFYGVKVSSPAISDQYVYVESDGLTLKNSNYTNTRYTENKMECHSAYSMEFYNGLKIDVKSVGTGTIELLAGALIFAEFTKTKSYVYGGNTGISFGRNGSMLGFFGNDGSAKKTVAKISSTASATASTVATTLNSLLDALKAYNLIG